MLEFIFELIVELVPLRFWNRFRRNREWEGVVEEIRQKGDEPLSRRSIIVVFRLEDGSTARLKVKREESDLFSVGQRFRKPKGETLPRPI